MGKWEILKEWKTFISRLAINDSDNLWIEKVIEKVFYDCFLRNSDRIKKWFFGPELWCTYIGTRIWLLLPPILVFDVISFVSPFTTVSRMWDFGNFRGVVFFSIKAFVKPQLRTSNFHQLSFICIEMRICRN